MVVFFPRKKIIQIKRPNYELYFTETSKNEELQLYIRSKITYKREWKTKHPKIINLKKNLLKIFLKLVFVYLLFS